MERWDQWFHIKLFKSAQTWIWQPNTKIGKGILPYVTSYPKKWNKKMRRIAMSSVGKGNGIDWLNNKTVFTTFWLNRKLSLGKSSSLFFVSQHHIKKPKKLIVVVFGISGSLFCFWMFPELAIRRKRSFWWPIQGSSTTKSELFFLRERKFKTLFWSFLIFLVSKSMQNKGIKVSRNFFCMTVPKNIVEEPFCLCENFWNRRTLYIRGITVFRSNVFV